MKEVSTKPPTPPNSGFMKIAGSWDNFITMFGSRFSSKILPFGTRARPKKTNLTCKSKILLKIAEIPRFSIIQEFWRSREFRCSAHIAKNWCKVTTRLRSRCVHMRSHRRCIFFRNETDGWRVAGSTQTMMFQEYVCRGIIWYNVMGHGDGSIFGY